MTITMYAIPNCDTTKKARAWLEARGVAYEFHDYRSEGVPRDRLEAWCRELGWARVCNRASTTFRELSDRQKANLTERKAITLMLAHPTLIKRPLLDLGDRRVVGFSPEAYQDVVLTP